MLCAPAELGQPHHWTVMELRQQSLYSLACILPVPANPVGQHWGRKGNQRPRLQPHPCPQDPVCSAAHPHPRTWPATTGGRWKAVHHPGSGGMLTWGELPQGDSPNLWPPWPWEPWGFSPLPPPAVSARWEWRSSPPSQCHEAVYMQEPSQGVSSAWITQLTANVGRHAPNP